MDQDRGSDAYSRERVKRACDQCQFRKMKCDGNQPCQRCSHTQFECSFQTNRRSKRGKGRRVELLRQRQGLLGEVYQDTSTDLVSSLPYTQASPPTDFHINSATPQAVTSDGSPALGSQNATSLSQAQHVNRNLFSPPYPSFESIATSSGADHSTPPLPVGDEQRRGSYLSSSGRNVQAENNDAANLRQNIGANSTNAPSAISSFGDWPSEYTESEILQWVDIFFDRLYYTLPLANRSNIYHGLLSSRHHTEADFGAMILSICAISLVQPVYMQERASMPSREEHAKKMLDSAAKMRSSCDFGERPSIEAIVTSFLTFATLFGMSKQKAAWLKLREAAEIGRLLGLHRPETYQNLSVEESDLRLRVFLILSVTERGYALQRNHYISFTGQNIRRMQEIYARLQNATTTSTLGVLVYDNRNTTATLGLLQLMKLFDSIDEDVIPCWNKSCSPSLQSCSKLTRERVRRVYEAVTNATQPAPDPHSLDRILSPQSLPSASASIGTAPSQATGTRLPLSDLQWADMFVLQQWLLTRLWVSCVTHDLLSETSSEPFMRPSHAVTVAERTLLECARLGEMVLEVHGIGMIERIYDIAMGVVMAMQHYAMRTDLDSGSGSGPVPESGLEHAEAILGQFFDLLGRLRGGSHPFSVALREAYESLR